MPTKVSVFISTSALIYSEVTASWVSSLLLFIAIVFFIMAMLLPTK